MIRKFTILNINFRFLNFFILAFLLLPNTKASTRTWHNGQTIFDNHVTILSGGLVSPKSGSGSADGNGISACNPWTTYQSIFTSEETCGAVNSIIKPSKYDDSRTEGSCLDSATNGSEWTTNLAIIGGFGESSAATFAAESYIVPASLAGANKHIPGQGNSANTYLKINANQASYTVCAQLTVAAFIDNSDGGGTKNNGTKVTHKTVSISNFF